jgi:hypothetical protein
MLISHGLFSFGVFFGAFVAGPYGTRQQNSGVNKIMETADVPSWALATAFDCRDRQGESRPAPTSFLGRLATYNRLLKNANLRHCAPSFAVSAAQYGSFSPSPGMAQNEDVVSQWTTEAFDAE